MLQLMSFLRPEEQDKTNLYKKSLNHFRQFYRQGDLNFNKLRELTDNTQDTVNLLKSAGCFPY